jgi:hypothetical protein
MVVLAVAAAACSWSEPYTVLVGTEPMMVRCRSLGAVTALADVGGVSIHPKYAYSAQDAVLRKAEMMSATHVVWVSEHYAASAVDAYYCAD